MVETFSKENFAEMPWKNGGGKTLELFKISNSKYNQTTNCPFLFRISMATINTDGPFSFFSNINRTLFLTEGRGVHLDISGKKYLLEENFKIVNFTGEDTVNCQLIDGPCKDFNVMTDKDYGHSHTTILNTTDIEFRCNSDFKFIYDFSAHKLIKLKKNEIYNFKNQTRRQLVIIDLEIDEQFKKTT